MEYKLTAIDGTETAVYEVPIFLSNIADTLVVRLPKGISEVDAVALFEQLKEAFKDLKVPVLIVPAEIEFLRLEARDAAL